MHGTCIKIMIQGLEGQWRTRILTYVDIQYAVNIQSGHKGSLCTGMFVNGHFSISWPHRSVKLPCAMHYGRLKTTTVGQKISLHAVNFNNKQNLIVVITGEFFAEHLSSVSSAEAKFLAPQNERWSRGVNSHNTMAGNTWQGLIATRGGKAYLTILKLPQLL